MSAAASPVPAGSSCTRSTSSRRRRTFPPCVASVPDFLHSPNWVHHPTDYDGDMSLIPSSLSRQRLTFFCLPPFLPASFPACRLYSWVRARWDYNLVEKRLYLPAFFGFSSLRSSLRRTTKVKIPMFVKTNATTRDLPTVWSVFQICLNSIARNKKFWYFSHIGVSATQSRPAAVISNTG